LDGQISRPMVRPAKGGGRTVSGRPHREIDRNALVAPSSDTEAAAAFRTRVCQTGAGGLNCAALICGARIGDWAVSRWRWPALIRRSRLSWSTGLRWPDLAWPGARFRCHNQGDGDRGWLGDSRLPISRTANTWPPPATPTVVAAARHPAVNNRFLTAESCLRSTNGSKRSNYQANDFPRSDRPIAPYGTLDIDWLLKLWTRIGITSSKVGSSPERALQGLRQSVRCQ